MAYVYSLPKRRNADGEIITVVHIHRGETYGEQPETLGLGEIAEVADRAYTKCGVFLKKYVIQEEEPQDMNMCKLCTDEDTQGVAEEYRHKAWERKNEAFPDALAQTRALLKGLKKKK